MEVRSVGPRTARIAIVGEAPGREEVEKGLPFVGASGRLLDQLLASVGINRWDCYVTNVMTQRPPNNDFSHFYFDSRRTRPKPELVEGRERLIRELSTLPNLNVIIALGAEALKALTGKQEISIGDWRGSILPSLVGPADRPVKVVATYHPAMILRQWSWHPIAQLDLKRAKEESLSRDLVVPQRTLLTHPTLGDVLDFFDKARAAEHFAFDIETIKRPTTTADCIGIALSPDLAMCVPFCRPDGTPYWTFEDELTLWQHLAELMADPKPKKIAQNAQFDILILRRHGVRVANLWMDTMCAMHTVYPEFPKSLDFLASVFTREPFYKDQITVDRWRYNATDAAVTYEVAMALLKEMQEFGVERFYFTHVHPLLQVYMEVYERGVLVDQAKLAKAREQLTAELDELQRKFDALTGGEVNPLSPKQVGEYLYQKKKLPAHYSKSGALTTSEEALKMLFASSGMPEIELILEIRARRKLLSTYIDAPLSADGRMRTIYVVTGTETGRLSSRASMDNEGMNLQNVPKGICREVFVPDPGYVFVAADLSQAEARVVAELAGEKALIDIFNSGGDVHRKVASLIFQKPESAITDKERALGKRTVHASNYGMGPIKFARWVGLSTRDAKALQARYFETFPRIQLWQKSIEDQIRRTRILENPFGRKRQFFGRLGPDLFREAYAYIPQSTVADCVHRATNELYARLPEGAMIMLNTHDSLTLQCRPEQVDEVKAILKEALERPFDVCGRLLSIPAEVKVGTNWNEVS